MEQHVGVDLGAAGGGRQGDVTVAGGVELSGHHGDSWGGGVCLPARLNNKKNTIPQFTYTIYMFVLLWLRKVPQTL